MSQSEYLLYILYFMHQAMPENDEVLFLYISIFEVISLLIQLIIFGVVYSATDKKETYTMIAFAWILFNPISLLGGFTNLGSFNDTLFYLLVLLPICGEPVLRNANLLGTVNSIVAYFDPRLIFVMIPFTVLQARIDIGLDQSEKRDNFKETLKRLFKTFSPIILTIFFFSDNQFRNLKNILLVNNPTENLGNFWYLMHEMFAGHRLTFFKYIYLIM